MATKYLLPCLCGATQPIDVAQAGQIVRCQCGRSLDVPTMRDIRRLEQMEVADHRPAPTTDWNRVQGSLFAIGLAVTVIALIIAAFLWINRMQLDTTKPVIDDTAQINAAIDDSPPVMIWSAWQEVEHHGLGPYIPPDYVLARRESAALLRWMMVLLVIATGGAVTTIAAFFLRRK